MRPFSPSRLSSLLRSVRGDSGFTFVEVMVAMSIAVVFGMAVFSTNQRLLLALRSQKETTAATMVLQQRMEQLRASAFSDVAKSSYVQSSITSVAPGSEGPLGNLTETITVSKYPADSPLSYFSIIRNAANPTGAAGSSNGTLSGAKLLRVDVQLDWTGTNARSRTRMLSSIFGIGNVGP